MRKYLVCSVAFVFICSAVRIFSTKSSSSLHEAECVGSADSRSRSCSAERIEFCSQFPAWPPDVAAALIVAEASSAVKFVGNEYWPFSPYNVSSTHSHHLPHMLYFGDYSWSASFACSPEYSALSNTFSTYYFYPDYEITWPLFPRFRRFQEETAWLAALFLGTFATFFGLFLCWSRFPSSDTFWFCPFAGGSLERVEWISHSISQVHAVFCCIFGVFLLFLVPFSGLNPPPIASTFGESSLRNAALCFTGAYLLFDLLLCFRYWQLFVRTNPLIVVHHIVILAAFTFAGYFQLGTYYCSAFVTNEFSTLFLNGNYFLAAFPKQRRDWTNSKLYVLNGLALLCAFFVARVVLNAHLLKHLLLGSWGRLWWMVEQNRTPPFIVGMCAILSLLAAAHCTINLLWFIQLARAVKRKLSKHAHIQIHRQQSQGTSKEKKL